MKLTKQGVRDLGSGTAKLHVHRYTPSTHVDARTGRQLTTMRCYCGDIEQESDNERELREAAEEDARVMREQAAQYGWGRR